jgi:dihydroxyacetone kinase
LSDPSTIEVGLGIHGEPGLKQAQWQPAQALVKDMLDVIVPRLPTSANPGANPGATTPTAAKENEDLRPVSDCAIERL